MNAVDVKDLKTVVRISQLGAHELNPVRPTLAFLFFWKRLFITSGRLLRVHVSLFNRFHPTTRIPFCLKTEMFLQGLALNHFTILPRTNQCFIDIKHYQSYLVLRGSVIPMLWSIRGSSTRKGDLFQALGIWKGSESNGWNMWKGRDICHLICKMTLKGYRRILWLWKSRENLLVVWFITCNDLNTVHL